MTKTRENDESAGTKVKKKLVSSAPKTREEALAIAEASGASLKAKLDIYSGYSRFFSNEINDAYDELIGRLNAVTAAAPAIGAIMPGFVLPDHEGKFIAFESLVADGPVVLSLNRGHWCPWCRLEVRALAQIHAEARDLGAHIVSIVPETLTYSRKIVEDNALPFSVLTDTDLGYTLSLGLAIWTGDKIRKFYLENGLDLALFHSNAGSFLPVPATFVVGPGGMIIARFVDPDFRKRMEPDEIITALKSLK